MAVYHSHPSHPYRHLKKTKHLKKSGSYRRRSHKLPRRNPRTGRFVRSR